jgi:hypothetical protein
MLQPHRPTPAGSPAAVAPRHLLLLLSLAATACADDSLSSVEAPGDDTGGSAEADSSGAADSQPADTVADTAPGDTTPDDTVADTTATDTAIDGSGDDVAADGSADTGTEDTGTGDTGTEDTGTEDTGTTCGLDPECAPPYACIGGVCRLPVGGTTWAEDTFRLEQPEELSRVFALLKSFAPGVAFFVVSAEDLPGTVTRASYGTANILSETSTPIDVAWQRPTSLERITLRPFAPAEAPLDGETWVSDPFEYRLDANVNITLPGRPATTYSVGFTAVNVTLELSPQPVEPATAAIRGMLTRGEAQSRILGTDADMAPLRALFCTDTTWESASGSWALADLLDCNGAVEDADSDGDGSLDGYLLEVAAAMRPARIVLP